MKRRYVALIIVVAVSNLVLVGIQMVRSMPSSWFEIEPKKATLDDQRKFLKEHEDELLESVKKLNPDITSIQLDWSSVDEGTIGNGTPQGGGKVVEVEGAFNHIKHTQLYLQFSVSAKTGLSNLSSITTPNGFKILKGKVWEDYE